MSEYEYFLDSPEAEVSLFRSIMRTRPVGIHRHAHILAVHNSIYRDTGFKVPMQDLWAKLGKMYDLDTLEHGVSFPRIPLCSLTLGGGVSNSTVNAMAVADTFGRRFPPQSTPHIRVHRNSSTKIPIPVPTPHLPTKTSRPTQASNPNSTHPRTTNLSNPTSPSAVSAPPPLLPHHRRHQARPPPRLGAHRIRA